MMNSSLRAGLSFGLTSGIITTLGLMVGLQSGTHSKLAVIGGVLTIAIADALSDALGIHISLESQNKFSNKELWEATASTFISKAIFAMTLVIPLILFNLTTAVLINLVWSLVLLGTLNIYLARREKAENPWEIMFSHLGIALIVVVATHYLGVLISLLFS